MDILLIIGISSIVFCIGFVVVKAIYTTYEYVRVQEFEGDEYEGSKIKFNTRVRIIKAHKKKFVFGIHTSTVEYFRFGNDAHVYKKSYHI